MSDTNKTILQIGTFHIQFFDLLSGINLIESMDDLPSTSPVRTAILSSVARYLLPCFDGLVFLFSGLLNTRVSEVMNLHRITIGRAKNNEHENRSFNALLLPLITRDKMKDKQKLLQAYFQTIVGNEDNTKSGIFVFSYFYSV
jgi:hypothetical protein